MRQMEFKTEKGTFKKVQKRTARKHFENGEKIYVIPCKGNPLSVWVNFIGVDKEMTAYDGDFDKFVNSFEYYNCNAELGKHASFYVKIA